MPLAEVIAKIINPGLAMLPLAMDSPRARLLLIAIGRQESKFKDRAQVLNGGGKGPARGFWQFEQGGGVKGVMTHPATTGHAIAFAPNVACRGTVQRSGRNLNEMTCWHASSRA